MFRMCAINGEDSLLALNVLDLYVWYKIELGLTLHVLKGHVRYLYSNHLESNSRLQKWINEIFKKIKSIKKRVLL
jgi:hypothetical protein